MAERTPVYLDFANGALTEFGATDTISPSRTSGVFPVNSVALNTDNVNPATSLGYGTWSSLGSNTIGVTTVYYFKRTA